uniref:THAP domain-containing protein 1 n=1 Tax=Knipowitschia caucasica TaxID=637954 RepID=A0AAV2IX99_KNICA
MPSCSAFNCTNGSRSAKHQFQLFRFPLNEKKRLAQWVAKVRRKNWVPSSNSRLCAAHFAEECFLVKGGKDHTYASKFENVELTEDKVIEFDQHTQSSIFDTSSDMSSTHEPQHSSPPKTAVALHSTSQVHLLEDGNTGVDELHIQDSELTQDSDIDKLQFSPQITSLVQSAITLDHQYVAGDIQESELTQDSDIDKLQFSPQITSLVQSAITLDHQYVAGDIQESELTQDSDIDKLQFSPQITSLVQSAITLDHQYVAGDIQESELTQDSDIDKLQFSPQIRHFVKSSITRDALVIMVVAIDDSWKLPVAYFFIDSLTGEERANILEHVVDSTTIPQPHSSLQPTNAFSSDSR